MRLQQLDTHAERNCFERFGDITGNQHPDLHRGTNSYHQARCDANMSHAHHPRYGMESSVVQRDAALHKLEDVTTENDLLKREVQL